MTTANNNYLVRYILLGTFFLIATMGGCIIISGIIDNEPLIIPMGIFNLGIGIIGEFTF